MLLVLTLLVVSVGSGPAAVAADASGSGPGVEVPGLLGGVEVPANSTAPLVDGVAVDHLLEVWSATWCLPCLDAEAELLALEASGSLVDIAVLEWHPWNDSVDGLGIPAAEERKAVHEVVGFPTVVAGGDWALLGGPGSAYLGVLVENLTSHDAPAPERWPRIVAMSTANDSLDLVIEIVDANGTPSAPPNGTVLDLWLVEDGVQVTANDTVVATDWSRVVRSHHSVPLTGTVLNSTLSMAAVTDLNASRVIAMLRSQPLAAPAVWAGPAAGQHPPGWVVAADDGEEPPAPAWLALTLIGLMVVGAIAILIALRGSLGQRPPLPVVVDVEAPWPTDDRPPEGPDG